MASQQKKQQAKGTLLGFFKKVDGPSPASASSSSASPTQRPSSTPKQPSKTPAVAKSSSASTTLPPSPPTSVSAGGSVSPVASSSRAATRPSPSSPDPASLPNPFKTPQRLPTATNKNGSAAGRVTVDPRSGLPTPPASSPLAEDDEDDDEEDAMPSISRRAVATRKRTNYFESGSEDEDGSEFEADDSDASPPPQRQPPAKKARPSIPTTSTPRQSQPRPSFSAPSRPPMPRASTSASSANKQSPTPESSAKTGFPFLNDRKDMDGNRPGDADFDPRTLYIPSSAWEKMSKFEVQYFKIKQWNMDTILMFQKGKFYEMFLEDSEIAHRELDLKLTDRGKMPMVGVPEASFDMFATKLLALGYKVGRVDQMETAVAKGMRSSGQKGSSSDIVRRELRHVMTSGTMIDGLEDDMANYCIAISENVVQQGGEDFVTFGMCMLDAATSEFTLAQWTDDRARSELETLLRSHRVKEIIHKKGHLSKETLRIIRNCVSADCRVTMLRDGKEWLSADDTISEITELFGDGDQDVPESITSMLDKEEAVSAMGGMFAYLTQLSLLQDVASARNFQLLEARRTASGQPMKLDANTLSHLCVLQNEDGSDTGTLLRLLNRCITPSGKRLFRLWLTHPLSDTASIDARLDAVDDLMGNIDFEDTFVKCKKFPDFERLIPKVYSGKIKPAEFTGLLTALKKVTPFVQDLRGLTSDFRSHLVKSLLARIPDVASLADDLDSMFKAEEDGSFQPHAGVDEDFDAGQAQVEDVEEQLESELRRVRKKLGLGSQKSGGCNWKHRGTNEIYQIEVPIKTKVPDDWMQISATAKEKGWYSPLVKSLVLQLKEARETRLAALKNFHARLFEQFNQHAESYMSAVRSLAQLDCLVSLAQASYAMGEPTCRPTFVDSDRALVEFEDLRHPCIATTTDFIANDVKMGGDAAEVILLTGGNMAGKSTTARTSATAIILAQLGCRVPAKSARISPVDRICSRMGANDQIFRNSSTFMVEMQEASRIVKECTPRSLVIMDELGRGTSTFDGHAIAHAVLHHLVARTRCLCFFLTHYLQLAYDFQGYPRCSNKHMEVLVDDELREVVFTYRLVDGVAESSYGTQVAGLAGVPREICDRANDISREFAEATKQQQAQRTTSKLPMSSLSDFAYLFGLGRGSGSGASNKAAGDVVSQLEVIRAQIQRVASGEAGGDGEDVVMTDGAAGNEGALCTSNDEGGVKAVNAARTPGSYGGRKRRRVAAMSDGNDDDDDRHDVEGEARGSPRASKKPTTKSPRSSARPLEESPASRLNAAASPTTAAAPPPRKEREQMILDLGQKIHMTCRECAMSYDRPSAEDNALHAKHHERVLRGVEWASASLVAAGEQVQGDGISMALGEDVLVKALGKSIVAAAATASVGNANGSSGPRIDLDSLLAAKGSNSSTHALRVLRYPLVASAPAAQPGAGAAVARKVGEVEQTIDEALGAARLPDDVRESSKLYVGVVCGRVVCAAVAGSVPRGQARRVLYNNDGADAAAEDLRTDEALFASSTPLDAANTPPVGIHRIYTLPSLRGRGLAHHLLDVVLDNAVYGIRTAALVASRGGDRADVVAFSQPTQAGRRLGEGWLLKRRTGAAQQQQQHPNLVVFQE